MSKIVYLVNEYPNPLDTGLDKEVIALQNAGFDLHILSLKQSTNRMSAAQQDSTVPVTFLDGLLGSQLSHQYLQTSKFGQQASRSLRAQQVAKHIEKDDFIFVRYLDDTALIAKDVAHLKNAYYGVTSHLEDAYNMPLSESHAVLSDHRCCFVINCTNAGTALLKNIHGTGEHIATLRHGHKAPLLSQPIGRKVLDGRQPNDPVILLSVCRIVEKKGLDTTLKAVARLHQERPDLNFKFVHIGDAIASDDQGYPLAIKDLPKALGIADIVEWHGLQGQEYINDMYQKAHIYASTGRTATDGKRESLPKVVIAAAQHGLPILGGNHGGLLEFSEHNVNALLADAGDIDSLTQHLSTLIEKPTLREKLGLAARQNAVANFNHAAEMNAIIYRLQDDTRAF